MEIKKWLLKELPEWAIPVPFQIKAIAVKDACAAVKKAKKDYKRTGKFQKVSFRSYKDVQQSIFIPKSAVKPKGIYPRSLGKMYFSESIEVEHDCRLTFKQGRWFFSVPIKSTQHNSENQGRMVALDPGVRTFQTFFSPISYGKVGHGDFSRIVRLCLNLDDLISRMSKVKAKQRYRMKKAANRLRWKIRDLISELHNKTAIFLVKNFDLIVIPTFETSNMALKAKRKIRAKSVRSMLSLSHYKFKEHLKFKAWEYGKRVIEVCEAYTSKTCSWNGEIVHNLGGRKFITDGNIVMDRDFNGGRGIFLRSLVDSPSLALCKSAFVATC